MSDLFTKGRVTSIFSCPNGCRAGIRADLLGPWALPVCSKCGAVFAADGDPLVGESHEHSAGRDGSRSLRMNRGKEHNQEACPEGLTTERALTRRDRDDPVQPSARLSKTRSLGRALLRLPEHRTSVEWDAHQNQIVIQTRMSSSVETNLLMDLIDFLSLSGMPIGGRRY